MLETLVVIRPKPLSELLAPTFALRTLDTPLRPRRKALEESLGSRVIRWLLDSGLKDVSGVDRASW